MTKTAHSTPEATLRSDSEIDRVDEFDTIEARYWSACAAERADVAGKLDETIDRTIADTFCALAWTPAPRLHHVAAKVKILQHAMGEAWANARIEIMVAGIRKDLETLGA